MSTKQKWLILALILLPSLIGIILLVAGSDSGQRAGLSTAVGKKIGLVRVYDVIYTSDHYVQQLRDFRTDNSVAGVVLRINSPGGTVAPSQEIYSEVLRFRDSHKPLVVSMENVAASGGYYIAAPAFKIFANPGSLTGSFGVFMRFPQYHELAKKVGIGMNTLKAGKYKDIGNPHREMTREERRILQDLLHDTHEQFIGDIAIGRSIDTDSVRGLADGRIFTGRQAQRLGLVDTLGGYQDALAYLKEHLDLPEKTKVVEKKERSSLLRRLLLEGFLGKFPLFEELTMPSGTYFLFQGY